ncbi:MAG: methyltransferase domain-containing protein [Lachnospiraceae bacterium]|nr:methyltransferase domain-containing protein [Lachnospiraceae bacterium]
MDNERAIVLDALTEINEKGGYFHIVMSRVLEKYSYLPQHSRHFIRRLCAECVSQQIYLDFCINVFSKTKTEKMKPLIREIMRMGAAQILLMDKVPDHAAVGECVKLAKKRGLAGLTGFVNGVLRNLARNKDKITLPDRNKEPERYLSIKYSMPEWIVSYIFNSANILDHGQAADGQDESADDKKTVNIGRVESTDGSKKNINAVYDIAEKIISGMTAQRKMSVRFSERIDEAGVNELLRKMQEQGIEVIRSEKLAYAYFLEHVDRPDEIHGLSEGLIYPQDIGSMMVVEMAGIKAGDQVIDVCAAPGGKTLHAADKLTALEERQQYQGNKGAVLSCDKSDAKVMMIEENLQRCGFKNVKCRVQDATVFNAELEEAADVIIADLPCSGLGVMGRKPDIRYRITRQDITDLASLQKQILQTVYRYVKPGGTLMYSTCTITREENEDNRDWILLNLPFALESELRLIPGIDGTDGFYIAKLKRI